MSNRNLYIVRCGKIASGALPKNRSVLFVCQQIAQNGKWGSDVEETLLKIKRDAIFSLDGNLTSAEFVDRARDERAGKGLDESRWFLHDNQLIHSRDRTYAVSSNWGDDPGGRGWDSAISALSERFPDLNISYEIIGE